MQLFRIKSNLLFVYTAPEVIEKPGDNSLTKLKSLYIQAKELSETEVQYVRYPYHESDDICCISFLFLFPFFHSLLMLMQIIEPNVEVKRIGQFVDFCKHAVCS